MKLEDKLLSLRKQQGLTQLELAEALHISRQAISKWETGEATPSLENLKSLSQLYQVPLGQLLGEDQPPVQPPQAEPKEETDGDPPAAELAGEEVPPGEISKPSGGAAGVGSGAVHWHRGRVSLVEQPARPAVRQMERCPLGKPRPGEPVADHQHHWRRCGRLGVD